MNGSAIPRGWWHYAETHYETPLRAQYDGLDPKASYRVRVVYGSQEGRKVRLTVSIVRPRKSAISCRLMGS